LLGWNADLVILNPTDFFSFASERATGGDNQYVAASGWTAPAGGTVWGMRKALTPFLTQGTAIVLDSSQFPVLDREAATLTVDRTGFTNLTSNSVTMLAEGRWGLGKFSPSALLTVDLS
jgi:hypothetical protein